MAATSVTSAGHAVPAADGSMLPALSVGWLFLELSGPDAAASDDRAYPSFAHQVEQILRQEADVYLTEVVAERSEGRDGGS